jgi:hypothetical protein
MVTQVILHIGMHYTGTTSFQTFLNDHRAELAHQGISVYRPLNKGINGAELRPAAQIKRGVSHFESVKSNIRAQCDDGDGKKLVASAESLWTMNSKVEIERLKSLFPVDLDNLKIILVLRDVREEEGWARKLWSIPASESIDKDKVLAFLAQSIEGYRAVFKNVELLTYQKTGMVELLCESCGIDTTGLKVDYLYHKSSGLKRFMMRRFPGLVRFYSRNIARSTLGQIKRKLFNE